MSPRSVYVLLATLLLIVVFSSRAGAQVASVIYSPGSNQVRVSFTDDIKAITLTNTLVFFEDDSGRIVQVLCDASQVSGLANAVTLRNFRDLSGAPVSLMRGGGIIMAVPSAKARTYNIVLKGVQLTREPKARPIQTSVDVSSDTNKAPVLTVAPINNSGTAAIPYNRRIIDIHPEGITSAALLSKFQAAPGTVKISYKFSKDDPAPDVNTTAESLSVDPSSGDLIVEPKEKLPLRAKKYTVRVLFPADQLRGVEDRALGFLIPVDAESVTATAVAELIPSGQTERAKTEFFIETTLTSTVSQKNRERTNVGIFGIHWKPVLPLLTYNVFGEKGNKPVWMAFRPLLEADFDTQSTKVSKSPNRILFGMDHELGRDAGLQRPGAFSFIQQHVWINGIRYDSDRDFKLQTIYWHTEYVPRFLNFEQNTEERQFAFDVSHEGPAVASRGSLVSSYRVRPSIGYELGGIVKRDARAITTPTDNINRPFFNLDLAVEFRRVLRFGVVNTYYFLGDAERRRHRDYMEGRLELNTGFLFNRNFNGLQNAITLKYQRGDQPPTFGSVNAFSLGFKIFR